MSILLVDDGATTSYLNKMLLNRLAVAKNLFVAENGCDALATLARTGMAPGAHCPALILLAVNMPVMNGPGFLKTYASAVVAN